MGSRAEHISNKRMIQKINDENHPTRVIWYIYKP